MSELSHLNASGDAHMVDVGNKNISQRSATATASVLMAPETLELINSGGHKKGDVFAAARIAGIMAAKKTSELIPLCHPLALTSVTVDLQSDRDRQRVVITATCKLAGKTGVEMEALTAASVAALTLYDMCKAVDKNMTITEVAVLEKLGGKSSPWHAQNKPDTAD